MEVIRKTRLDRQGRNIVSTSFFPNYPGKGPVYETHVYFGHDVAGGPLFSLTREGALRLHDELVKDYKRPRVRGSR